MLINHNDCSGYYYKHCQTIPNSCLPWVWIISLHGRFIMECTTLISYFDRGARRMAVILLADEPWLVLAGGFEWKKGLFLFWNDDPQFISISGDDTHIEHMENHHAKNGKPWCLPSISIGAIENPWRTGWTWRTMISMDVVEGGPKKSTESKKNMFVPTFEDFSGVFFPQTFGFPMALWGFSQFGRWFFRFRSRWEGAAGHHRCGGSLGQRRSSYPQLWPMTIGCIASQSPTVIGECPLFWHVFWATN